MSFKLHHDRFLLVQLLIVRILSLFIALNTPTYANQDIQIILPSTKINAEELGVIYLEGNQESEAIARYYQSQRNIPEKNVIGIQLSNKNTKISAKEFIPLKQKLDQILPNNIQALALTWAQPYQVGCMSMTSAFAFGYDEEHCAQSCETTKPNSYHNSKTIAPYTEYAIRPTMMLAAQNLESAKALIDRGVSSDYTRPFGKVYLLNTSDFHRSVRNNYYDEVNKRFNSKFNVQLLKQDSIKDKQDILFYFTGLPSVPDIKTLTYLPGAMADHLTSAGGQLTDSFQMSAMEWLEAGATGSYGAAIEPCNYTQKFPNPIIAMTYYTRGSTLIEAYWKSVLMPGQGNFIGEPLAAPFTGYDLITNDEYVEIHSPTFYRGTYTITSKLGENTMNDIQKITKQDKYLKIYPPYQKTYTVTRINES